MHREMLKAIVADCREYSEKNGLVSHIEHWSKEQLAFAISDMASEQPVQGESGAQGFYRPAKYARPVTKVTKVHAL